MARPYGRSHEVRSDIVTTIVTRGARPAQREMALARCRSSERHGNIFARPPPPLAEYRASSDLSGMIAMRRHSGDRPWVRSLRTMLVLVVAIFIAGPLAASPDPGMLPSPAGQVDTPQNPAVLAVFQSTATILIADHHPADPPRSLVTSSHGSLPAPPDSTFGSQPHDGYEHAPRLFHAPRPPSQGPPSRI